MKAGLILIALSMLLGAGSASADRLVTTATSPPVVVSTFPKAGSVNVSSKIREIRVTFSKRMLTKQSWSWVKVSGSSFPKITGKVKFLKDERTCVAPVRLEPKTTYAIWFNHGRYKGFRGRGNRPAVPYLLVFETGR